MLCSQTSSEVRSEVRASHKWVENYLCDLDTSKLRRFECSRLFEWDNTSDTECDRGSTRHQLNCMDVQILCMSTGFILWPQPDTFSRVAIARGRGNTRVGYHFGRI